ncbi:MAG TPA: hypothetical protein VGY48_15325 [Vicinamibacterales bacterium]|jgi:hypothetical protein|nr:hypothetical protein [Vicinamibacterales bacterium]
MNNLLNDTYLNGTTTTVVGMIGRVASTGRVELAQADTLAHLAGLVGVVRSGSVAAATNALEVATHGHQKVLLETGLTPNPGDVIWVSATVAGRGTNVQPIAPNISFPIGTIKTTTAYATKGVVGVDVGSLAAIFAAAQAAAAAPVAAEFSMFYGLTAGTGNGGATDYAGTIAVKTSAGTGRVPFPRSGPISGAISNIDGSSFMLPDIGTYEITFEVHTTELGQLQLELGGVDQPQTCVGNFNPTAGGHPYNCRVYVTTVAINTVLAVINPAGNSTALTVTPANGSQTHANAQTLTIRRIA